MRDCHRLAAQLVRPARSANARPAVQPQDRSTRGMSSYSNLDRESFQQLLASAFAVQQSQMDSQSLSAIVEVQRLIAKGELDVDGAMRFIVDCARNVANATGVASCLLKEDQLVYQAGSGSAAPYVGRHMMATLSAPEHRKASSEILRVENAQTDARVEAAICRQFGAKALLILPIYHQRAVAGVLEVLFSEAHVFQDREVRTYRLMAGLIGEAMSHAAQLAQTKTSTMELPTTPHAIEQVAAQSEKFRYDVGSLPSPANKHAIDQCRGAAMAGARKLPTPKQSAAPATMLLQEAERVPWHKSWGIVTLAAIVTVLALTCWIAYRGRQPAWPLGSSTLQRSTAIEQPVPFLPAKAASAKDTANLQIAPAPVKEARVAGMFRRVRVGENEVDYVAEDVTVRYFTPKPATHRVRVGTNEVAYIGEDVTVRYFTPETRSSSVPANSVPSKPAQR